MTGIGMGLAGLSMAQKLTRVGIALGVAVLLVVLIVWRFNAYGDRREQAGIEKERAAWVEAGVRMKAEAALSATKADDKAAVRLEQYKEQVDEDRKALDIAVENGDSPLDALFGG